MEAHAKRKINHENKVSLYFSATNLEDMDLFGDSDPQLFVKERTWDGNWAFIGKTEVIDGNENPVWNTPVEIIFRFQKRQQLLLTVGDNDGGDDFEKIGSALVELSEILAGNEMGTTVDLRREGETTGSLNIKYETVLDHNELYTIDLSASEVKDVEWFSQSDPYIRLCRPGAQYLEEIEPSAIPEDGWEEVVKTEFVKDNLNPDFRPLLIDSQSLNRGDTLKPVRAEVWDHSKDGDHEQLSHGFFNVQQLIGGRREIETTDDGDRSALIKVQNFEQQKVYTISDYFNAGLMLNTFVIVDFTESNGNQGEESSLHYASDELNRYQRVIQQIGSTLCGYDSDQYILGIGFGAKVPARGYEDVSDCFPLSPNPQSPWANGVKGIWDFYNQTLTEAEFGGPAKLAPSIRMALRTIKAGGDRDNSKGSHIYSIILIACHGEISDDQDTKDAICEAAELPVSIVVVGLADEPAEDMRILDGDNGVIRDSSGNAIKRDVVQYVHYKNFMDNENNLSEEVLKEIPNQVVDYFVSKGILP